MTLVEGCITTTSYLFDLDPAIKAEEKDGKIIMYPKDAEKLAKYLNSLGLVECQQLLDTVEVFNTTLINRCVYAVKKEYEYKCVLTESERDFFKDFLG